MCKDTAFFTFSGTRTLIVGGASGIGAETSNLILNSGGEVLVIDKESSIQSNAPYQFLLCDISDAVLVYDAIEYIKSQNLRIDNLVITAGVHSEFAAHELTNEEIDSVINTNLKGVLYVLRSVLPIMQNQKSGAIVLMGSDQSFIAKRSSTLYGLTKASMVQLAKSIAIDYAEDGIRANTICPGTVNTKFARDAISRRAKQCNIVEEDIYQKIREGVPLGRLGKPIEVANMICFLLSPISAYITGASILIDGGFTCA